MLKIILLSLLLVSCTRGTTTLPDGAIKVNSGDGSSAVVQKVTLEGVDCYVLVGAYKGGISCLK